MDTFHVRHLEENVKFEPNNIQILNNDLPAHYDSMSNHLISNLKTQHTRLRKMLSNQSSLDGEIQKELKDLGI